MHMVDYPISSIEFNGKNGKPAPVEDERRKMRLVCTCVLREAVYLPAFNEELFCFQSIASKGFNHPITLAIPLFVSNPIGQSYPKGFLPTLSY